MDQSLKKKAIMAVIMVLLALILLSGATYAWFTSNQAAKTNRISGQTSSESVTLYLSPKSGADFVKKNECTITQVNSTDQEFLLPVSTDDLITFVNGNGTGGYSLIENESQLYHGRVYMMAEAEDNYIEGRTMDIYLENTESMIKADTDSLLMNAARLGLVFDGKTSIILNLSNTQNSADDRISNTYIDGVQIADGMVIHSNAAGSISAVEDPSVYYRSLDITADGSEPLITIELNKEYVVDIYFYLEGCDPDCSDSIQTDGGIMNLQFMGILNE